MRKGEWWHSWLYVSRLISMKKNILRCFEVFRYFLSVLIFLDPGSVLDSVCREPSAPVFGLSSGPFCSQQSASILSPSSSDFHFVFFFRFVSWCSCWFSRNSKFWSWFSVQRRWFFLLGFLELRCCFSTAAQDFSFAAAGQVCSLLEFSIEDFVFPERAGRRHLISWVHLFPASKEVTALGVFVDLSPARPFSR
jgi:hypothetical protein